MANTFALFQHVLNEHPPVVNDILVVLRSCQNSLSCTLVACGGVSSAGSDSGGKFFIVPVLCMVGGVLD